MIRVVIPFHLRTLARVDGEVRIAVQEAVTLCSVATATYIFFERGEERLRRSGETALSS